MRREDILEEGLEVISLLTNVPKEKILTNTRLQSIVTARRFLYYYMKTKYKLGWSTIGRLVKRNHATIMHSYKYIDECEVYDSEVRYYKLRIDNIELGDGMLTRKLLGQLLSNPRLSVDDKIDTIIDIFKDYEEKNISSDSTLQLETSEDSERYGKACEEMEDSES